jgi:hypothetical protein
MMVGGKEANTVGVDVGVKMVVFSIVVDEFVVLLAEGVPVLFGGNSVLLLVEGALVLLGNTDGAALTKGVGFKLLASVVTPAVGDAVGNTVILGVGVGVGRGVRAKMLPLLAIGDGAKLVDVVSSTSWLLLSLLAAVESSPDNMKASTIAKTKARGTQHNIAKIAVLENRLFFSTTTSASTILVGMRCRASGSSTSIPDRLFSSSFDEVLLLSSSSTRYASTR